MSERIRVLVIAGVCGGLLGAIWVVIAYALHPALALEMDRSFPRRLASGLYDSERSGDRTFAWTSQRADIKLTGINRRTPWSCSINLRGGRSDPATQPSVDVAADGIVGQTVKATNEFQDATIVLPPRSTAGGVLTITSSSTLSPGPSDSRQLGIQIDRITCAPQTSAVLPPTATIRDASLTGAIFGVAMALSGLTLGAAIVGVTLLTALQSLPLSAGPAPYVPFSETMFGFAMSIAVATVVLIFAIDRFRSTALQNAARIVIVLSAGVLYLKLAGLLHPSKLPVDAVFHAHRLEWVLGGRYYFTQPMPGGVSFPYAIGLYLFAAPWSMFTRDYVTLLRVIVCAAQAIAGALLYPVVLKAWADRVAAIVAVALFNLVPLSYGLLGNANLTNTFGEAVALATVLTASLLTPRVLPLVLLLLLSSLGFLSHVGTFAILGVTLITLAVLYGWLGGAALRRLAWSIAAVSIVSALLAVVVYYGHFGDVYRKAVEVRATASVSETQSGRPPAGTADVVASASLASRVVNASTFAIQVIGWPLILLALVGAWRLLIEGARDRASLAVLAWMLACVTFLAIALMRVDAPFQRYAAEFFGRVLLATSPAAVLLAARATGWAWQQGLALRFASASLLVCAAFLGLQSWTSWFLW